MTAVQYVETILKNRWDSSDLNGDRTNTLPDLGGLNSNKNARVVRESAEALRKVNLDEYDVLFIRDGGVSNYAPQSFAWQEERVVSQVTVDIRTTGRAGSVSGRERLWGERDSSNNAPSYGGLTGEVKRVFDEVRKGHKEFDLILATEQNDLSNEMGGQIWRATTEVTLDVRANQINP